MEHLTYLGIFFTDIIFLSVVFIIEDYVYLTAIYSFEEVYIVLVLV